MRLLSAIKIVFLVCLFAQTLCISGFANGNDMVIKVMSYNIRCISPDGLNDWYLRRKHVAKLIKDHSPDLLGTQEAYTAQANYLKRKLKIFDWIGDHRGKYFGQRNATFISQDRFDILESGTSWLSDTPNVKGSIEKGTHYKRTLAWALVEDKVSGKSFYFLNTHFDHITNKVRLKNAQVVLGEIAKLDQKKPMVLVGDFNCDERSEPYKLLAEKFNDARKISETLPEGPEGTSWPFKRNRKPENRIDFVFVTKGISVKSYKSIDSTYGKGRHPSDHTPIMAEISL